MEEMEFYSFKKRKKVKLSEYVKVKYEKTTNNGVQVRYAFRGENEGTRLFKFCSKAVWDESEAEAVRP